MRRSSRTTLAWALQGARLIRQFTHEEELAGTNPGAAFTSSFCSSEVRTFDPPRNTLDSTSMPTWGESVCF